MPLVRHTTAQQDPKDAEPLVEVQQENQPRTDQLHKPATPKRVSFAPATENTFVDKPGYITKSGRTVIQPKRFQ